MLLYLKARQEKVVGIKQNLIHENTTQVQINYYNVKAKRSFATGKTTNQWKFQYSTGSCLALIYDALQASIEAHASSKMFSFI